MTLIFCAFKLTFYLVRHVYQKEGVCVFVHGNHHCLLYLLPLRQVCRDLTSQRDVENVRPCILFECELEFVSLWIYFTLMFLITSSCFIKRCFRVKLITLGISKL